MKFRVYLDLRVYIVASTDRKVCRAGARDTRVEAKHTRRADQPPRACHDRHGQIRVPTTADDYDCVWRRLKSTHKSSRVVTLRRVKV